MQTPYKEAANLTSHFLAVGPAANRLYGFCWFVGESAIWIRICSFVLSGLRNAVQTCPTGGASLGGAQGPSGSGYNLELHSPTGIYTNRRRYAKSGPIERTVPRTRSILQDFRSRPLGILIRYTIEVARGLTQDSYNAGNRESLPIH